MAAEESASAMRMFSALFVFLWLSSVAAQPVIVTSAPFILGEMESVACFIIRSDGTLTTLPLTLYMNWAPLSPTSVSMPMLAGGSRRIEVVYMFEATTDDDGAVFSCTQETLTGPLKSIPYTVKMYRPPGQPVIEGPAKPDSGKTSTWQCKVNGTFGEKATTYWTLNGGLSLDTSMYQTVTTTEGPQDGIMTYKDVSRLNLMIPNGAPSFVLACKTYQNATNVERDAELTVTPESKGTPVHTVCQDIWTTGEQSTINCTIPTTLFDQCTVSSKTFSFYRNFKKVCSGTVPATCTKPSDNEMCYCSPSSTRANKVLQYKVVNASATMAGSWFCHLDCQDGSLLKFVPKNCGATLRASITTTCASRYLREKPANLTCHVVRSSFDYRCLSTMPRQVMFSLASGNLDPFPMCHTSYETCEKSGTPTKDCPTCSCGCTNDDLSTGVRVYKLTFVPFFDTLDLNLFCSVQCIMAPTVTKATVNDSSCADLVVYSPHSSAISVNCPSWEIGPNKITCSINMTTTRNHRCVTYDNSMWMKLSFPGGGSSTLCTAPLGECSPDDTHMCMCVGTVADLHIYSYILIGGKSIPTGSTVSCHTPCSTEHSHDMTFEARTTCREMDFFGTTSICPSLMVNGKMIYVTCRINNHFYEGYCQTAGPVTFSIQSFTGDVVSSETMCTTAFPECLPTGTRTGSCSSCNCSCISPARASKYFIYEMSLIPNSSFQSKQLSCSLHCDKYFPWIRNTIIPPANDSSCTDITLVQLQTMAIRYTCPFPQLVVGQENNVTCSVNMTALRLDHCALSAYVVFELRVVWTEKHSVYFFPLCITSLHRCDTAPSGQSCHCLNHTGEMRYYQMNFRGFADMPLGSVSCRVPCLPDVSLGIDAEAGFFCLFMSNGET